MSPAAEFARTAVSESVGKAELRRPDPLRYRARAWTQHRGPRPLQIQRTRYAPRLRPGSVARYGPCQRLEVVRLVDRLASALHLYALRPLLLPQRNNLSSLFHCIIEPTQPIARHKTFPQRIPHLYSRSHRLHRRLDATRSRRRNRRCRARCNRRRTDRSEPL